MHVQPRTEEIGGGHAVGMTIAEKILARHAGKTQVVPGEIVEVRPDLLMVNDVSGPIAVGEFKKMGATKVFDPEKVAVILDHFTPNKDLKAARASTIMRNFAQEQGLRHFYDAGFGIEHVVLPELGLVRPGDLVIGADSHTTTYGALGAFSTGVGSTDLAGAMALGKTWLKVPETIRIEFTGSLGKWIGGKDLILTVLGRIGVDGAIYKVLEFGGPAIHGLDIDGRLTMCNMAVEAGAKAAIIAPDDQTWAWLKENTGYDHDGSLFWLKSDPDAGYLRTEVVDVSALAPQVAVPSLPANVRPVSDLRDVRIDQVVIGSCTNGRISDLRVAASILRGRKVHNRVRTLVIPGSRKVYARALKEGLIETFIEAGAVVCAPTCGPCFGGHLGILDEGESCVSTTNRNFIGRMGHAQSKVYLAGPAVAAASAILGRIAHPEEV